MNINNKNAQHASADSVHNQKANTQGQHQKPQDLPTEYGGPKGPEPTRFGDWEKNGRCSDF
ncbi:MAG: DUF1674 domain-containing protein [bacterium]